MNNENAQRLPDSSIEQVRRYASGAELIFANAEALCNEAQILGQAGSFARAATLHQISMEECSKIDTLGAAATSILMGHDVDETKLATALRDHRSKNFANAYNAIATEEEKAARERGDWAAASAAFKKFQAQFHFEVNAIKNAGLYVDFKDGRFTAPKDVIDETTAVVFMHLNADFLRRSDNFVRLLRRMDSDASFYAELVRRFSERAEAKRVDRGFDPEQATVQLMEEMYADYASKIGQDPGK
jgi:AbiV family abortive infection protein